jgi:hypothetical protein
MNPTHLALSTALLLTIPLSTFAQGAAPSRSPLAAPLKLTYTSTFAMLSAKAAACPKTSTNKSDACRAKALNSALQGADGKPVDYRMFGANDRSGWKFRSLKDITMLVVHNGGWTAQTNHDTWASNGLAAHYTIERDGHIVQHVGEEQASWHANEWNDAAIGVELNIGRLPTSHRSCNDTGTMSPKNPKDRAEVLAACEPSTAQYDSLRRLAFVVALRTNLSYDEKGIQGHCQNNGTHGDPKAFDWRELGLSNAEQRKHVGHCRWYDFHP